MTPTPEQLAEWRKEFERRTMTSAIWEYCPEEFGVLLDEVDRLNAALATAFERGREEGLEDGAKILDAAADRQKAAWDKLQAEKNEGPYTSFELIFRGFASAIRARKTENARLKAAPVVWADDATPFDGKQVKALLDENARLRAEVERGREKQNEGDAAIVQAHDPAIAAGIRAVFQARKTEGATDDAS